MTQPSRAKLHSLETYSLTPQTASSLLLGDLWLQASGLGCSFLMTQESEPPAPPSSDPRVQPPIPSSPRPRGPGSQPLLPTQTWGSRPPDLPPQTPGSRPPAPQHLGHWLQTAGPVSLSPKSCLSGSEVSVPLLPRSGSQGPSAPGVLEPRCLSPPHPTPGAHHGCGCLQAHGAPAQDQNQETHHRHPVVGEEGWDWSSGVPNLPPHRFPSQIISQPHPSPANLWSQKDNS